MRSFARISALILPAMLLFAAFFAFSAPTVASGSAFQATAMPMPPAGADGRILYTVLAGESQWSIAAKFGIPIQELQNLNSWSGQETLTEGQVILLGLSSQTTATATLGPESEVVATSTPENVGTGAICVLLFDDINGDALRQDTEVGIAGGQASISERTGLASQNATTQSGFDADAEPIRTCFEALPLGEYTISVAIPDGYNPTTNPSSTIQIAAGQTQDINFGAQVGSSSGFNALSPEEGGRSPLMGLLGVVMLLGGAGLGFYTLQLRRRR